MIYIVDLLHQEGTTKVVFAYHTDDPKSEMSLQQHVFRGSRSILLLNNFDRKSHNEKNWKYFDLRPKKNVRNTTPVSLEITTEVD